MERYCTNVAKFGKNYTKEPKGMSNGPGTSVNVLMPLSMHWQESVK